MRINLRKFRATQRLKAFKAVLRSKTLSTLCVYCGDPAEARDHFMPWTTYRKRAYLPACTDCNSALSTSSFATLGQRCKFLLKRLDRKYGSLMKVDYLRLVDECEGNLRRNFEMEKALADHQRNRMIWMDFVAEFGEKIDLASLAEFDKATIDSLETWLDMCHRAVA
jgi:hypothetical protein